MKNSAETAVEQILGKEIKVLNKGFVRLVDYMGGDSRIVQSARVSYGAGTKSVREDKNLIFYLMRNAHTSPFEQVVFTFHIKAPIFVARQWVRHRTARTNEVSGRYSVMPDDFFVPESEDIRFQSKDNKQGSASQEVPIALAENVKETLEQDQKMLYSRYTGYISENIARELARVNLPLSLYTEFYWQMDLHNLFHFLKLRLDSHAQKEIREYGMAIAECVKIIAPVAYEAFEEFSLKSVNFSGTEIDQLRKFLVEIDSDNPGLVPDSLKQKIFNK